MIYTCTTRYKDKNGVIYNYELKSATETINMSPDNLKLAIKTGTIQVSNLKLTSDGKLVKTGKTSKGLEGYEKLAISKEILDKLVIKNKFDLTIMFDETETECSINNFGNHIASMKLPRCNKILLSSTDDASISFAMTIINNKYKDDNRPLYIKAEKKARTVTLLYDVPSMPVYNEHYTVGDIDVPNLKFLSEHEQTTVELMGNIKANKLVFSVDDILVNREIQITAASIELNKLNLIIGNQGKVTVTTNSIIDYNKYMRGSEQYTKMISSLTSNGEKGLLVFNVKFGSEAFTYLTKLGIKVNLLDKENQPAYDKMLKNRSKEQMLQASSIENIIKLAEQEFYISMKEFEDDPANIDLKLPDYDVIATIPRYGGISELYKLSVDRENYSRHFLYYESSFDGLVNEINLIKDLIPLNTTILQDNVINLVESNNEIGVIKIANKQGNTDRYAIAYEITEDSVKIIHIGYMGNNFPPYRYYNYTRVSTDILSLWTDKIFSKVDGVTSNKKLVQRYSTYGLDYSAEYRAAQVIIGLVNIPWALYIKDYKYPGQLVKLGNNYKFYKDTEEKSRKSRRMKLDSFEIDRDFNIDEFKVNLINEITKTFKTSVVYGLIEQSKKQGAGGHELGVSDNGLMPLAESSILWQIAMKHRKCLLSLELPEGIYNVSGCYTYPYSIFNKEAIKELFSNITYQLIFDMIQLPIFEEYKENIIKSKNTELLYHSEYIDIYRRLRNVKIDTKYNTYANYIINLDNKCYVTEYNPSTIILWLKHIAAGQRADKVQNWVGNYYSKIDRSLNYSNYRGFLNKVDASTNYYIKLENGALQKIDEDPILDMTILIDDIELGGYWPFVGDDKENPDSHRLRVINNMRAKSQLALAIDNKFGKIYLLLRNLLLTRDWEMPNIRPYTIYGAMDYVTKYYQDSKYAVEMCTFAVIPMKDTLTLFRFIKDLHLLEEGSCAPLFISHIDEIKEIIAFQINNRGNETVAKLRKLNNKPFIEVIRPYTAREGKIVFEVNNGEYKELKLEKDAITKGWRIKHSGIIDKIGKVADDGTAI